MLVSSKHKSHKEIYDLKDYGFPEVPLFGVYVFDEAEHSLSPHTHSAFEICYLAEGRQNYRAQGVDYLLKGGDIFITGPNETHSTGKQPQEKGKLFWIHLMPPKRNRPYLGLHPIYVSALYADFLNVREKCFPASDNVRILFEKLYAQISMPDEPVRKMLIGNILASLVIEITSCGKNPRKMEHEDLNKIIKYMNGKAESKISVPEMARFMDISESRFKARFRHETGMPPAEYFLRLKIARAKEFLESGKGNVSDAAMRYNFSSSQYFATTFRRFTGRKPSSLITPSSKTTRI